MKCEVCGRANHKYISRCDEHYRCDDCGTRDNLVTRSEGVLCPKCHDKRVDERVKTFDGDTNYTENIICPHCGDENGDSWESGEGETQCDECGRLYEIERIVDVSYCTTKIKGESK